MKEDYNKLRSLTQDCARIDPIIRRIQAFHSRIQKHDR